MRGPANPGSFLPLLDGARLRQRRKARTAAGTLEFIVRPHTRRQAPTVVLISGAGVGLKGWSALFPAIEALGTVFAWNRFGVGGSDRPRTRQHGAAIVASLRELLAIAGLPPPYVLIGHSLGGLYANLFARLHPDEVAACLLLEATHPGDRAALREHEPQVLKALGKLLQRPQERFRANVHSELEWVDETAAQIATAGPFPPVPLTVLTGGMAPPARRRRQQELAQLSPHGRQVIAQRSGHFPQLSEPKLVLRVLGELVRETEAEQIGA